MDKVELPLLKGSNQEKAIPLAVVFGVIGMLVVLLIIFLSLTIKGEYKLRYSDRSSLDYKVYLKENNFYESKYLPKDKLYISTLIDYVDANFDYSFRSEENIGLEYNYYVTATVQVNNSEGKNIFSKSENIVEKKNFKELDKDTFTINEDVKINYKKYNKLASEFVNELDLSADSKLVVSLYVDVVGKHAKFDNKFSDKAVITLEVPLTNRTVDISMDYELSNNEEATLQYRSTVISNPVLFAFAICLAIADMVAIGLVINHVVQNRDNLTLYNKKLTKILRDYNRYISETVITERVEDMMRTRSLRIEVVKTFENLVDIRDSLEKPILYHEERPGEEAIFYIISDKVGYLYVMRASEMRKGKEEK